MVNAPASPIRGWFHRSSWACSPCRYPLPLLSPPTAGFGCLPAYPPWRSVSLAGPSARAESRQQSPRYAGIAYASALSSHVNVFSDEPIYWVPFAAVLVVLSGFLPGRRGWRVLHDASPGTLLAGLAVAAMAVVFAIPDGSAAPVLGLSALLLGIVWVSPPQRRVASRWGRCFGGCLAAIAGGGWLSAGFAGAALVETALAEYRRGRTEAVVYRWVGAVFWVAAYVFFVVWSGWSPETVTAVTITLGAVVSGIALAAHLLAPTHRITEMWLWPIAAVGQTALVGAGLYAGDMLTNTDAVLPGRDSTRGHRSRPRRNLCHCSPRPDRSVDLYRTRNSSIRTPRRGTPGRPHRSPPSNGTHRRRPPRRMGDTRRHPTTSPSRALAMAITRPRPSRTRHHRCNRRHQPRHHRSRRNPRRHHRLGSTPLLHRRHPQHHQTRGCRVSVGWGCVLGRCVCVLRRLVGLESGDGHSSDHHPRCRRIGYRPGCASPRPDPPHHRDVAVANRRSRPDRPRRGRPLRR